MILEADDKLLNDIDDHKVEEAAKWGEKLEESYDNLRNVVSDNLPNLWPALEFALSVKSILNIRQCNLPFAGIVLGPPSSLKTVNTPGSISMILILVSLCFISSLFVIGMMKPIILHSK